MPARLSLSAQRRGQIDERAVVALRNEYLHEIAKLAMKDGSAPLVERARELLKPRYWAKSTWRERSKILESVRWLLRTNGNAQEFTR